MYKKIVFLSFFILVIQAYFGIFFYAESSGIELQNDARHSGDQIDVNMGTAPTIDGTMGASEWTDAATTQVNVNGTICDLYLKHDGTNLYVAYKMSVQFMCDTVFDLNHDGGSSPNTDDILLHASAALYERSGTGTGWSSSTSSATGWTANTGFPTVREYSITLTKLGITSGNAKTIGAGFRFSGSGFSEMWPSTGNYLNPGTWGNIFSSDNWGSGGPVNRMPELSGGLVTPDPGFTTDEFTFNVTYLDKDNDTPAMKKIVIDGIEYDMTTTDNTYDDGSNFIYKTNLGVGDHNFYFKFNDSKLDVRLPLTGTIPGPEVILPNEAPQLVSGGIPNATFSIDEDSGAGNDLIDLEAYFDDDFDNGNLRFELIYEEDASLLDATIDGQYLDVEQKVENWFGTLDFQVKATDRGLDGAVGGDDDLFNVSNVFHIKVNPTSDPTIITKVGNKNVESGKTVQFTGSTAAVEDEWFNFTIIATDADIEMGLTENLAFYINTTLINIDMDSTDPLKANASFLPGNDDVGTLNAELTVEDNLGVALGPSVNLTIQVKNQNDAPKIIELEQETDTIDPKDKVVRFTGVDAATEEEWFNFTVIAEDPDIEIGIDDELIFDTNISMDNFNIDKKTGEVSFLPTQEDVGVLYARITVRDKQDIIVDDHVDLIIDIRNVNDAPRIQQVNPDKGLTTVLEGKYLNVSSIVSDPDIGYDPFEKLSYSWESDKDGNIGNTHALSINSLTIGVHNITFKVTDNYGASDSTMLEIMIKAVEGPGDDDKKPTDTPDDKKSDTGDSSFLWILIPVVVIVVVAIVIAMLMMKRKKKPEEVPNEPPQIQQYPVDQQGFYPPQQGQTPQGIQDLSAVQQPVYGQDPYGYGQQDSQMPALPTPVTGQAPVAALPEGTVEQPVQPDAVQQTVQDYPPQMQAAEFQATPQVAPAAMDQQPQMPQLPQGSEVPTATPLPCPTCGQATTYFQETNGNYCYPCQKYV